MPGCRILRRLSVDWYAVALLKGAKSESQGEGAARGASPQQQCRPPLAAHDGPDCPHPAICTDGCLPPIFTQPEDWRLFHQEQTFGVGQPERRQVADRRPSAYEELAVTCGRLLRLLPLGEDGVHKPALTRNRYRCQCLGLRAIARAVLAKSSCLNSTCGVARNECWQKLR